MNVESSAALLKIEMINPRGFSPCLFLPMPHSMTLPRELILKPWLDRWCESKAACHRAMPWAAMNDEGVDVDLHQRNCASSSVSSVGQNAVTSDCPAV